MDGLHIFLDPFFLRGFLFSLGMFGIGFGIFGFFKGDL